MRRVLVVDDELGIAETLRELLSDEGFHVPIARNGKEAIRLVEAEPPDLILLDYMMPLMDGSEVLQALRADPQKSRIPVVLMSSVPRYNLPESCRSAAFLRKPFGMDELLAEVEKRLPPRASADG